MAELVTDDHWLHNRVLADMMEFLKKRQFDTTPAELMAELFRRTARVLGVADPYGERKRVWQDEMLAAEEQFRSQIAASPKPLRLAVKLACMANLFDDDQLRAVEASELFARADDRELHTEVWEDFRRDVKAAKEIMFIHCAAGEILLDKLLLERQSEKRITSVVRAGPMLRGCTRAGAEYVGLSAVTEDIVDPGIDCLGLPLSQCSQEFRDRFEASELIIAKGQAAYETLCDERKQVYFLLRVKCRVMANALGLRIGDLVLDRN